MKNDPATIVKALFMLSMLIFGLLVFGSRMTLHKRDNLRCEHLTSVITDEVEVYVKNGYQTKESRKKIADALDEIKEKCE